MLHFQINSLWLLCSFVLLIAISDYFPLMRASSKSTDTPLQPCDEWIDALDLESFRSDIANLGKTLSAQQGPADLAHLRKMIFWSNALTFCGLISTPFLPVWTCVPAILLSLGVTSRWTMIAHHTCHGGYDKSGDSRYNRFTFGVGSLWRRALDWFDWFLPEAWNVEHNQLHHYKLGETTDPDLLERNMLENRIDDNVLRKYAVVAFIIMSWKWWYYAPNTFKVLRAREMRKTNPAALSQEMKRVDLEQPLVLTALLSAASHVPRFVSIVDFLARVMLPFLIYRFVLLPAIPLYVAHTLGRVFSVSTLSTCSYATCVLHFVLADVLANIHSFIIIATNHCGNDMYRFATPCRFGSGTFYLRQVVSSANFSAGTDVIDFFHGFLNYQVEHHLWPNLSMLSYQKAMPKVKAICKKHGVPYVQENVLTRMGKTVDIMLGNTSMRVYPRDREFGSK